ncbi:hypothetical protein pVco7_gp070 [Vibrio phage pVco-7]
MYKGILYCFILLLVGCSNGPLERVNTPSEVETNTYKKFLGIPVLASLEGTYTRLNKEWVLTAKHNKPLFLSNEFIPHPYCDVALVRLTGETGIQKVGKVYTNQTTYFTGYPLVNDLTTTVGHYLGDITIPNSKCLYSAASNHMAKGMSGGPVTTPDGNLVGIIVGFQTSTIKWSSGLTHDKPAVFISTNYIMPWIESIIGNQ